MANQIKKENNDKDTTIENADDKDFKKLITMKKNKCEG